MRRTKRIVALVLSVSLAMCPVSSEVWAAGSNEKVQQMENSGTDSEREQENLTTYDFYWDGSGKNITPDEEGAVKSENIQDDDSLNRDGTSQHLGNMNVSQNGIELIKQFEGCSLTAYKALSSEQYYTIGYGHYGPDVYAGMTITQEQAESMLRSDLVKYVGYVNTFLNKYGISINQNQFDALTSFTYNLGNVWVSYSTFQLKTYLINGVSNYTDDQITTAFTNWNKSGGVVIDGLTRRRKAEAQLFLKGISSSCNCSDSYAGNYTCTSKTTLNIRSGHGSGYSVVGSIPSGATVYVSKADGSWAHVSYNGVNGYASMTYLQRQNQVAAPSGYTISLSSVDVYNSEKPQLTITPFSGEKITNYTVYVKKSDGSVSEFNWGETNQKLILTKNLVGTVEFWAKVSNESGSYSGGSGNGSLKLQVRKAEFGTVQDLGADFYAVIKNKCGTLADYTVSKSTNVEGWRPNNQANQIWRFIRQADGSYKILSKKDESKALDVNDASNYSGANVQVYADNGSDAQRWFVYSTGDGYYYLRPKCSDSAVLDLYNKDSTDGTNIQIYTVNQTDAQKWTVEKIKTEFTIQYDSAGGSGAPASQVKQAGKDLTIAAGIPKRTGYEFRGWSTVSGSQSVSYLPGAKYTEDADQTLYAVWCAAKTISSVQTVNVDIAGTGRMYRITPEKSGIYRFESTGTNDTYITLYSSNGSVLATNDDSGEGANFLLEYSLEQGKTYYVEPKIYNVSKTGSFQMKVECCASLTDMQGVKIGGRAADALRINWTKNNKASGYIIEQYKNGNWIRIARIADPNTTTYRVEKLASSTTYKFRVKAFTFNGNTPVYSDYVYVNGKTNPATISGSKIGGRAGDALRLNWNKDRKASGYIIEQYKNNKWVRIARIASEDTTTYRVENLSPSNIYNFRIQAFGFDGNTALYGNYGYVSGKTNPAIVSGLKIGGTANDALRLNWNKDSKASGYIIEQYKNGKWTRIARIGSNATTTYRVEKLQSKTTYKFRVQSFGFDGSTALYGSYSYVSGVTR